MTKTCISAQPEQAHEFGAFVRMVTPYVRRISVAWYSWMFIYSRFRCHVSPCYF